MPEAFIGIHEIPFWTIVPFVIALVLAVWLTVRWVLKHPEPE